MLIFRVLSLFLYVAMGLSSSVASSGQISLGALSSLDMPHYPVLARTARLEGKVKVDLEISHWGNVLSAKTSGGHELLQTYALRNVTTWRFDPSHFTFPPETKTATVFYEFRIVGTPDKPVERVTLEGDTVLIETNAPAIESQTAH
jgi:TonB family protein